MDSLGIIEKSLDDLEEVLAPLLSTDLPQTLSQLELLQKAKLQVLLPYVVNDLVFIYLRTRGINPKTHPVVGELDRVKQYFDKIKKAEDPEKRRFAVDQGAATRFIKHAIKESQAVQENIQCEMTQGTHTRFSDATVVRANISGAAMAKIEARASARGEEESSSEESELEIFEEAPKSGKEIERNSGSKGKEKAKAETSTVKKRRRGMDPWAGYDETAPTPPVDTIDLGGRRRKKSKGSQGSSSSTQSITVISPGNAETDAEPESAGVHEVVESTVPMPSAHKAKAREEEVVEIIDVDALPDLPEVLTKTVIDPASQVIDVDALDSSRSTTPAQGKSKKKKKKRQTLNV